MERLSGNEFNVDLIGRGDQKRYPDRLTEVHHRIELF